MSVTVPVFGGAIPNPENSIESIRAATLALKQNVEVLTGAHTKYHVTTTKSPIDIALGVAIARADNV